jgi:tetratricopeptide (TPR) repeat protein
MTSHAAPLTADQAFELRAILSLASHGNVQSARDRAERLYRAAGAPAVVAGLLGALCCQLGDLQAGIGFLRIAHRDAPADVGVAVNLLRALADAGAFDEAQALADGLDAQADRSGRLWRVRGYLAQRREDYAEAETCYQAVVAAFPDDAESWNNLGNARADRGDAAGAVQALTRAADLSPAAPIRLNLAAALVQADRAEDAITLLSRCADDFPHDAKPWAELAALFKQQGRPAEAIDALEQAVRREPENLEYQLALASERFNQWDADGAEAAIADILRLQPDHAEALIMQGLLLEHRNREAELPALLDAARAARSGPAAEAFLEALLCRREKRFAEGLEALSRVPPTVEPVRSAQLAGQFHEGLGAFDDAFASFRRMNDLLAADPSDPLQRAATTRAALAADEALLTPSWVDSWSPLRRPETRRVAFLLGFPRSGTTLLDTMLMGHPDVQVLEEQPPLRLVEEAAGGLAGLATLTDEDADRLRDRYYAEVDRLATHREGALLVDKSPLHLLRLPLIRRLFPEAPVILALRHPCDVVLSCFITNFNLNNAMANFLTLETAAEFYSRAFGYWSKAASLLAGPVHPIVYEAMVETPEATLRPLFQALALPWDESVLAHRDTARKRGVIATASYAQVTEPLYRRAVGRWERYRRHLAPVLPTLQPWVERFGYAGD